MIKDLLHALVGFYTPDVPAEKLRKKYAHPESKYMDIDGMQVHYRDEGDKNDTIPLVLIHGTASSLHTWDACVDVWKKSRRVIRFDMPGFGLTGPNPSKNYTLDYYVSFVIKALDKLGVNTFYIAGSSWGGAITWVTALKHPNRVKKMIILNSDTNAYFKLGKGAVGFNLIIKLGSNPFLRFFPRYFTPPASITQSVKGVYYDRSKIKPETYELYKDFTLREGNREALIGRLTTPYTNYINQLKDIKTPTLVIWGRHDGVVPVEIAEIFRKGLPNNKTVILENSGHIPMEENPEIVAPMIEEFIGE
jgi:pimeloyl-ACP methyl ester carboxylesterase